MKINHEKIIKAIIIFSFIFGCCFVAYAGGINSYSNQDLRQLERRIEEYVPDSDIKSKFFHETEDIRFNVKGVQTRIIIGLGSIWVSYLLWNYYTWKFCKKKDEPE